MFDWHCRWSSICDSHYWQSLSVKVIKWFTPSLKILCGAPCVTPTVHVCSSMSMWLTLGWRAAGRQLAIGHLLSVCRCTATILLLHIRCVFSTLTIIRLQKHTTSQTAYTYTPTITMNCIAHCYLTTPHIAHSFSATFLSLHTFFIVPLELSIHPLYYN